MYFWNQFTNLFIKNKKVKNFTSFKLKYSQIHGSPDEIIFLNFISLSRKLRRTVADWIHQNRCHHFQICWNHRCNRHWILSKPLLRHFNILEHRKCDSLKILKNEKLITSERSNSSNSSQWICVHRNIVLSLIDVRCWISASVWIVAIGLLIITPWIISLEVAVVNAIVACVLWITIVNYFN